MKLYKPWKLKSVEEKTNSCMFWFRLFLVFSVLQASWEIFRALLLYNMGLV